MPRDVEEHVKRGIELLVALDGPRPVETFHRDLGRILWDESTRDESCGVHFREECQIPVGEALRDDERFAHVAVFEWRGDGERPTRHEEPLVFEEAELTSRTYK